MRGPYTLRVQGFPDEVPASELALEPAEDPYMREYNAGMLYKSACQVAARVSRENDLAVSVIGNAGSGTSKRRVEAAYYQGGRR